MHAMITVMVAFESRYLTIIHQSGGSRFQGSFILHYLYKVNMERKVRLQHMITR